jgi:hypothetical protein
LFREPAYTEEMYTYTFASFFGSRLKGSSEGNSFFSSGMFSGGAKAAAFALDTAEKEKKKIEREKN